MCVHFQIQAVNSQKVFFFFFCHVNPGESACTTCSTLQPANRQWPNGGAFSSDMWKVSYRCVASDSYKSNFPAQNKLVTNLNSYVIFVQISHSKKDTSMPKLMFNNSPRKFYHYYIFKKKKKIERERK